MERLLIIDDEPAIARFIQKVAEGCGYSVTTTHDAESFFDELIATSPNAIVLDLSLPGTDGIELLRFLSASKCGAKILIISGVDQRVLETSGRLGLAQGLNIAGTFTKPVRAADLRRTLMEMNGLVAE